MRTSSTSPMPLSWSPWLRPAPRKLKRSAGMPRLFNAFMAWKTTLLCRVPPYTGWGWQIRAAWVAAGEPSFSKASSCPAGPCRKKERMAEEAGCTVTEYNERMKARSVGRRQALRGGRHQAPRARRAGTPAAPSFLFGGWLQALSLAKRFRNENEIVGGATGVLAHRWLGMVVTRYAPQIRIPETTASLSARP